MNKYIKTAALTARERTNGGIIYLLPGVFIRMITLVSLAFLWRAAMSGGVDVGMTLEQMLTYTYADALLADILAARAPAGGGLADGVLLTLYGRPMSIFGQLAAQTVGGWIPGLLLFSLPMAAVSPLLGVNLIPASPVFLISLILCVSLGFAVDFLFACLSIRLHNMSWMIGRIRTAISALFSGSVIPVKLMCSAFASRCTQNRSLVF